MKLYFVDPVGNGGEIELIAVSSPDEHSRGAQRVLNAFQVPGVDLRYI